MQEKTVELRKLGNSGLEIAPLVFGGNVFGWTVDEAGASELLDRFVDVGFNMIDTADVYSNWVAGNHGGESETLIGKWLKKMLSSTRKSGGSGGGPPGAMGGPGSARMMGGAGQMSGGGGAMSAPTAMGPSGAVRAYSRGSPWSAGRRKRPR